MKRKNQAAIALSNKIFAKKVIVSKKVYNRKKLDKVQQQSNNAVLRVVIAPHKGERKVRVFLQRPTTYRKQMKKFFAGAAVAATLLFTACTDADLASHNLSKAAGNFEINRRIVFYNGITGEYMLTIEGLCSIGNSDTVRTASITCKTGPGMFKKHFLGLSDNVTFIVEQMDAAPADVYHYRVTFKPQVIVPDIDFRAG